MDSHKARRRIVPNLFTAFGLACGLFVIFRVNLRAPGTDLYELLLTSTLLIIVASVADFLDGAIARAFHVESDFGFQFDSLADAITFGVAPSVLMLKSLSLEHGSHLSFFAIVGALLFSICGVLRLVRYNVKKDDPLDSQLKKHFTGIPIPAGAACAISVNLFLASPQTAEWFSLTDKTRGILVTCLMIFIAYMMISKLKFPSLKTLHIQIPSFHLMFLTVIAAMFILYGILYYFSLLYLIFSWGYLLLGCLLFVIRLVAGKKSKTLIEFEPDDDDTE